MQKKLSSSERPNVPIKYFKLFCLKLKVFTLKFSALLFQFCIDIGVKYHSCYRYYFLKVSLTTSPVLLATIELVVILTCW